MNALLASDFFVAKAVVVTAAAGLQLAGIYAAWSTFGGWITVGLYLVGGLALALQHVVVGRVASCSPGD